MCREKRTHLTDSFLQNSCSRVPNKWVLDIYRLSFEAVGSMFNFLKSDKASESLSLDILMQCFNLYKPTTIILLAHTVTF